MKREISEIVVSFLALLLIFSAPFLFSLYNIAILLVGLSISFLGKLWFQKRVSGKKSEFRTDKKLATLSIALSFLSLGILRLASVGGFSGKSKKSASWGVGYNIALSMCFFMLSMLFESAIVGLPPALPFSIVFLSLSNMNIVLAISNLLPYGMLDGSILYKKDKRTFWSLATLSISIFFLLMMWFRFSMLYRIAV